MAGLKTLHIHGYIVFSLISSLVVLAIAVLTAYTNPFVAYPLFILTLMVLASTASGIPRLRSLLSKGDEHRYGVAVVQHAWWPASCGFAGLVMFHSEYFVEALGVVYSTVLLVLSAIWFIWGMYTIILVHKKTGASLMP